VAVTDDFAGLLLDCPRGLLDTAFYALPVHYISPFDLC
jgi:hypothetical protein